MSEDEQIYRCNGYYIPPRMMDAIRRYIDHGVLPGEFLIAVISNDLREAVGRADDENRKNLMAFVGYFYNEAPSTCWGSKEIMLKYAEAKETEREENATND